MVMKDFNTSASPPAIELDIQELVLHGFSATDRFAIGDAVQRELERLITEQGVPGLAHSVSADRLDGGVLSIAPGTRPHVIGAQVAARVHEGLFPVKKERAAIQQPKGVPPRR
jgi:hypothetical protein